MPQGFHPLFVGAALAFAVGPLAAVADAPGDTVITPVLEQPLTDLPGKVVSMITVEYAPGAGTPPHRHEAHTFVYVLSGRISMQVEGREARELAAGQTYYEAPNEIHSVSRNASATAPAKFLVFFLKPTDAEVLTPVQ